MNELSYGQPTMISGRSAETAKEYFRLGKTAASLERKKEEADQAVQMSTIQQALLQQKEMQLKDLVADIERRVKSMAAQDSYGLMGAPMGGGGTPMPPEVGPPMGGMGGQPPLPMGGPPPEAPLGDIGSIPSGDMGGGPPIGPPVGAPPVGF